MDLESEPFISTRLFYIETFKIELKAAPQSDIIIPNPRKQINNSTDAAIFQFETSQNFGPRTRNENIVRIRFTIINLKRGAQLATGRNFLTRAKVAQFNCQT